MSNENTASLQRDFNKFSVWLQSAEAKNICAIQSELILRNFASLITGPQIGLVDCDDQFSNALADIPGLVQKISSEDFVQQRNSDFPAASLNSIVIPFGLSFTRDTCNTINWDQLSYLLAPGGKLLVTGVNPHSPAQLLSRNKLPAVATRDAAGVRAALSNKGFETCKGIFHGISSRTPVPSIYCSRAQVLSPLFYSWAILFKQSRPCGTLVGKIKPSSRKQTAPLGHSRQS